MTSSRTRAGRSFVVDRSLVAESAPIASAYAPITLMPYSRELMIEPRRAKKATEPKVRAE